MSVAEYFMETYGVRLQYPGLPCAKVHKKRDIFIPLEMLEIAAQKRMKALTPKQTQKIVRTAATKPQERMRAIKASMKESNQKDDPLCVAFGIMPQLEPVSIEVRTVTHNPTHFCMASVLGRWSSCTNSF